MTEDPTDARPTAPAGGPRRGRQLRPSSRGAVALLSALAVLVPAGAEASAAATRVTRDVIVYGGTPAGVAAAVAAADNGAQVTLLAEGTTVGGMMSNGISASDIGSAIAVQGVADEFFDRVRSYYQDTSTWRFEPRVAERILRRMLAEEKVLVRFRAPLSRVTMTGSEIACVVVPTERSYCAESFVDASYTGELLAAAGVPHRLGMADLLSYGEPLAARRGWRGILTVPAGQEDAAAAAFSTNPFMRPASTLPAYRDAYAQGMPSLTYRLCVTSNASNKVPFRPSADYAKLLPSFRILARGIRPTVNRTSYGTLNSDVFQLARLPGDKYDLNAGYRSFTNVPAPAGYFDSLGSRRYWNTVLRHYVGDFFYFAQRDPSVPGPVREELARFGLCKDEFTDNGSWPRQPYVREARRIVGKYTMTERDIFTVRTKTSAIALASYNVDSKVTQWRMVDGTLYRDLSAYVRAPVYEIPYTAMVPRSGSVVNVLAPVAVSASPVAYGSLRMEPQYMAMGQAAGIAAALGASRNRTLANLPFSWVQQGLRADGVLHKALDACRSTPTSYRAAGGYDAGCTAVLPVPQVDA